MESKRDSTPRKVVLYVRSVKIPSGTFVDREGAQHACARAGSLPFAGLSESAKLIGRFYPDADYQALHIAQAVEKDMEVKVEVVDLSSSFWLRLKLRRQGIRRTPQFVVNGRLLPKIESSEQLASYLNEGKVDG